MLLGVHSSAFITSRIAYVTIKITRETIKNRAIFFLYRPVNVFVFPSNLVNDLFSNDTYIKAIFYQP